MDNTRSLKQTQYAQSIRKITQKRIGRKQLKDNVKIEWVCHASSIKTAEKGIPNAS